MNETYLAVVDRIVDGEHAVVLRDEPDESSEQLEVPIEVLPYDARHEGAVVEIDVTNGDIETLRFRPEREASRRTRLQEKFDRLSRSLDDDS